MSKIFNKCSQIALGLGLMGIGLISQANQVHLVSKSKKTLNIVYRLAFQKMNESIIYGDEKFVKLHNKINVTVAQGDFKWVGLVPVSINGHALPSTETEFNQPQKCSMTTDASHRKGSLIFSINAHKAFCKTIGGVFN